MLNSNKYKDFYSNPQKIKGRIQKQVRYCQNLTANEKLVLEEIIALDIDPQKGCFCSNAHFNVILCKKNNSRASQIVTSLRTKGFIRVKYNPYTQERNIFYNQDSFYDYKEKPKQQKIEFPVPEKESSSTQKTEPEFKPTITKPDPIQETPESTNTTEEIQPLNDNLTPDQSYTVTYDEPEELETPQRTVNETYGQPCKVLKAPINIQQGPFNILNRIYRDQDQILYSNRSSKLDSMDKCTTSHPGKLHFPDHTPTTDSILTDFFKMLDQRSRDRMDTPGKRQKMRDTIEKCVRIDNYTLEEVDRIVKWAKTNFWWKDQFFTLNKLRTEHKKSGLLHIQYWEKQMKKDAQIAAQQKQKEQNTNEQKTRTHGFFANVTKVPGR